MTVKIRPLDDAVSSDNADRIMRDLADLLNRSTEAHHLIEEVTEAEVIEHNNNWNPEAYTYFRLAKYESGVNWGRDGF
tara:strand:+ start:8643 stop:8876 length:234 start_codon:yes stop_codon:yes gene_type:complete